MWQQCPLHEYCNSHAVDVMRITSPYTSQDFKITEIYSHADKAVRCSTVECNVMKQSFAINERQLHINI
jgi:hypothetical protein